jgi:hypothetical protein
MNKRRQPITRARDGHVSVRQPRARARKRTASTRSPDHPTGGRRSPPPAGTQTQTHTHTLRINDNYPPPFSAFLLSSPSPHFSSPLLSPRSFVASSSDQQTVSCCCLWKPPGDRPALSFPHLRSSVRKRQLPEVSRLPAPSGATGGTARGSGGLRSTARRRSSWIGSGC